MVDRLMNKTKRGLSVQRQFIPTDGETIPVVQSVFPIFIRILIAILFLFVHIAWLLTAEHDLELSPFV